MGVRGRMYLAAGGSLDVTVDEDVALAESIRRLGGQVVSTRASSVTTSARLCGQAAAGMAAYLRDLVRPTGPAPTVPAQERAAAN